MTDNKIPDITVIVETVFKILQNPEIMNGVKYPEGSNSPENFSENLRVTLDHIKSVEDGTFVAPPKTPLETFALEACNYMINKGF